MSENDKIIEEASPHTVKKFELIEKYTEAWAQKLLNNPHCEILVFIDCMCNSGEYRDKNGNQVFGTPVRVAKKLRENAEQYPKKQIRVYFNDLSSAKTRHLEELVGKSKRNFHIEITTEDANEFLKILWKKLKKERRAHCLLIYDPYEATIDWVALQPFFNTWGEVIINHMVSDSIRAMSVLKSSKAISKYENTYLTDLVNLLPYGKNKTAYEKRVEEIIQVLSFSDLRTYYIATVPFFNTKNSIVYNLIHCTQHIKGFILFKECVWRAFNGKSSLKNTHGTEKQMVLDFEGNNQITTITDKSCYNINDIAKYLQERFDGCKEVPLKEVWGALDLHPVFPSNCFKNEIKEILKNEFNAQEFRGGKGREGSISFMKRRNP